MYGDDGVSNGNSQKEELISSFYYIWKVFTSFYTHSSSRLTRHRQPELKCSFSSSSYTRQNSSQTRNEVKSNIHPRWIFSKGLDIPLSTQAWWWYHICWAEKSADNFWTTIQRKRHPTTKHTSGPELPLHLSYKKKRQQKSMVLTHRRRKDPIHSELSKRRKKKLNWTHKRFFHRNADDLFSLFFVCRWFRY